MGSKRDDRRQAIVAVATHLFCAQGYSHTTMSMIASRLGGSKATLWAYFRSKEDLFAAAMEAISAQGEQLSRFLEDTEADITTVLERFGCAYLRFVASEQAIMVRRAIISCHARFAHQGISFVDTARLMLGAYLAEKLATTHVSINYEIAARNFLALIECGYLEPIMFGFSPVHDEATVVGNAVEFFTRAYDLTNV